MREMKDLRRDKVVEWMLVVSRSELKNVSDKCEGLNLRALEDELA